jgi:hypothetical protein
MLPVSSCLYVAGSDLQPQCHTYGGNFGRILSAFELFFLPANTVSVTLKTADGVAFRELDDQGAQPRCYCVLPAEVKVAIEESSGPQGGANWESGVESCLADLAGPYDCSICDFLTILEFDLKGIPRGATATLSSTEGGSMLRPFRLVNWVGGIDNHIAALRSGAGTGPQQTTHVTVNDNGAAKTLSNVCSGKVCKFEPFTCSMCLDLSNPEGVAPGKGVCDANGDGFLTTVLKTAEGQEFRSIPNQGCCNGCEEPSLLKKRTEYSTQCGRYTVLCDAVGFELHEMETATETETLDCSVEGCSATGLIQKMSVDLQCGQGITGYPTVQTNHIDITLLDNNGDQLRGPRTIVYKDCSIGPEFFTGPTCQDVGNMNVMMGVIKAPYQVRVEQIRVESTREQYPDLSEHPTVLLPVSCINPADCNIASTQVFSMYWVQSQRGLPDLVPGPPTATIKFGNTQQNVMTVFNALADPPVLSGTELNQWCVLADHRPWYAVNWEAYASAGPNKPFTSCENKNSNSFDICTTDDEPILVIPPSKKK